MSQAPYVRTDMLPPAAPPVSEIGVVRWMRENLFSGWVNSVLTVLSVAFILYVITHLYAWFANGVWDATSLSDCRDILAARGHDTGACFAVISERWHQYLFGFYPSELYWRPILAFVLMFVALAPILFSQLPRQALWLSAAYPGIMYFLLWGETIWGPLLVYAGFGIGYAVYGIVSDRAGNLAGSIAAPLSVVLWWLLAVAPLDGAVSSILPIGLEFVDSDKFGGFLLSVVIGVTAIAFSLPLGILLALGRQSDLFIIQKTCVIFIEVIRGVPLIVWLFVASLLLAYFLPPGTNFDILLRVVILVTFFSAAYLAEVIRGGLAALPKGQYEAADALGLDYWKAQRLIIMPQALKISIPGIVNTFIGLFKDTTLVVFVGLLDPLKGITDAVRATPDWNGVYWEPYIFVGLLFWLSCFGMSRYSLYLERRLKTDHR